MLSKQALESAVPLADVLESSKLYVEPVKGSLLEALVQASRTGFGAMGSDYVPGLDDIQYLANAPQAATGLVDHDVVMDEIALVGIQSIQGLIAFSKTVVGPSVIALTTAVNAELANTTKSALRGMEVIPVHTPAIMFNDGFKKEVRRYDEMAFDDAELQMRCPTIPTSEVRELMKIGGGNGDSAIADWLAMKGDGFVTEVWETIFQISSAPINETARRTLRTFIDHRELGLDWALAVYLISRRLLEQGPLENTEMPVARFEGIMSVYRDQSALALCREFDRMETAKKTGKLVLRATEQKVYVESSVYDDWIAAGGEIEVLYGNILDGNNRTTVDQINEAADMLKMLWTRHERVTTTTDDNRRYTRTISFLLAHFRAQLLTMTDAERLKITQEAVMNLFMEELRKVTESELSCLYSVCLRLVCRARYPYWDAEVILSSMDEIQKKNPGIDADEAMAMATIRYTARWMAEQFKVMPLSPI